MRRSMAAILAVPTVINGFLMLVAGPFWYESVPGASETGPFNPHFVQDIGAAFVVAGLALAARAWRPRYWTAAVAGAGFLAAHALIHLVAMVSGHDHRAGFDLIAVVIPSALALYSAFPAPGEHPGEHHA
jgi:peptidoglycan/LPS O-acetylase OafA/YrhL